MRIVVVTPAPAGSRKGNRVTAVRWGRLLRELGHRVALAEEYRGQRADVLIALHARKSAGSVEGYCERCPGAPLVVALTGTDLYADLAHTAEARRSLELADRLVVLQPLAVEELPVAVQGKARVIYQSVPALSPVPRRPAFDVCVIGHLREVKDPFRTALAARELPATSRIRIVQVGGALDPEMAAQAREEQRLNPRYRWVGEVSRPRALRLLGGSRLLALTSKLEGGANVISEAVALDVPVISSRIAGSVGLLGADYPGYFPVGDTVALTELLTRAERDADFLGDLTRHCRALRPLFTPAAEREAWRRLLAELG